MRNRVGVKAARKGMRVGLLTILCNFFLNHDIPFNSSEIKF